MAAVEAKDILFRSGGSEAVRTGVPWLRGKRYDGREVEKYTHTRADAATCASYWDRDGVLRYAAANKLRLSWDYATGYPGLLLEGSRTNVLKWSEDLSASTVWTVTSCTVTTNAVAAPDGATTADSLTEGSGNAGHNVLQSVTIASGQAVCLSFYAKAGTGGRWAGVRIAASGGTNIARYAFNLATGSATTAHTGSPTVYFATMVTCANGWYRCAMAVAVDASSTVALCGPALCQDGTAFTYLGDGTSNIYIWGIQAETGVYYPTSYIPTTTASVTRAADALTFPVGFEPQDLTVYVRMVQPRHAQVTAVATAHAVLYVGSAGGSGSTPRIGIVFDQTNRVMDAVVRYDATTAQLAQATTPTGTIEVCAQYRNLTTAPQARLDVGSGFGSYCTATTPWTAWGSQTVAVGGLTGYELDGSVARVLVLRGAFTLAECQAVAW